MLISMDAANETLPLPTPGASGDELFRMGLLYSTGQGGAPLDYVSAHMLFNLAAMRGSEEAKQYRLLRRDVKLDGWIERKYLNHALTEQKLENYWPLQDAAGKFTRT